MITRQQKNKDKFFEFLDKTINPEFSMPTPLEYKNLDKKGLTTLILQKKFRKKSKAK